MFELKVLLYKTIAYGIKLSMKVLPITQPLLFAGKDSSQQLAVFIGQQKLTKVLLVTDEILLGLGLANPMIETLKQHGCEVEIFSEIKPDPTDTVINQGIQAVRKANCDAVIGFGGGSSIDAAKMIATLAHSNKSIAKVSGILKIRKRGLPLFAIPTTAGTGSEVTLAAVVTEEKSHQKMPVVDPCLMPVAAALDPVLMAGMPPAITAATGMDALTHAVEAYLSKNASDETDRYAMIAVKLIFENLAKAYNKGDDLQAREATAIASFYAGMAFTKAGVGYVHAIAHQLGAKYQVPHGLANAIVLPHILDFSEPDSRSRLSQLADGLQLEGNNEKEKSAAFINAVKELKSALNIPEKVEKLEEKDIDSITDAALKEAHYLYAVPRYMNPQQCNSIVRGLLS